MATAGAAFRVHRGREAAPIHALIPGSTARFRAALRPSERAPLRLLFSSLFSSFVAVLFSF